MAEGKESNETVAGSAQGRDPFVEEVEDPALLHVIDGWDIFGDKLIIHGHIEAMTVSTTIRRAGLGGDAYDSDEIRTYTKMLPKNLGCDIIIDKPVPMIREGGDGLAIVGHVLERFARETSLKTYEVMVKHNETVHALKDGRPQKKRVSAGKEVTTEIEVDVL